MRMRKHRNDWRRLFEGETTPWDPSVKRERIGDWIGVIRRAVGDLKKLTNEREATRTGAMTLEPPRMTPGKLW